MIPSQIVSVMIKTNSAAKNNLIAYPFIFISLDKFIFGTLVSEQQPEWDTGI